MSTRPSEEQIRCALAYFREQRDVCLASGNQPMYLLANNSVRVMEWLLGECDDATRDAFDIAAYLGSDLLANSSRATSSFSAEGLETALDILKNLRKPEN